MDMAGWAKESGRREGVERETAARRADPVYRRWCEADDNGHKERGGERVYRRRREADDRGRKKTANLGSLGTYLAGTLGPKHLSSPKDQDGWRKRKLAHTANGPVPIVITVCSRLRTHGIANSNVYPDKWRPSVHRRSGRRSHDSFHRLPHVAQVQKMVMASSAPRVCFCCHDTSALSHPRQRSVDEVTATAPTLSYF